jgi:hypothetical protein
MKHSHQDVNQSQSTVSNFMNFQYDLVFFSIWNFNVHQSGCVCLVYGPCYWNCSSWISNKIAVTRYLYGTVAESKDCDERYIALLPSNWSLFSLYCCVHIIFCLNHCMIIFSIEKKNGPKFTFAFEYQDTYENIINTIVFSIETLWQLSHGP